MRLIRRNESWSPFREMEELSTRMNQLFQLPVFGGNGERELLATMDWSPSCDIRETASEYRVHAELPGVRKADVHVTLENDVLTIKGERREEKETKDSKLHRRELSYGNFFRQFTMPPDADESKVDAKFQDGILNIVIPKSKSKQTQAREIAVQ